MHSLLSSMFLDLRNSLEFSRRNLFQVASDVLILLLLLHSQSPVHSELISLQSTLQYTSILHSASVRTVSSRLSLRLFQTFKLS